MTTADSTNACDQDCVVAKINPGYIDALDASFTDDFGQGAQTITMNLGTFGLPNGITQYSGTALTLRNITQDGTAPGAYAGIAIANNGNVSVNYTNGQSRVVAQVPLVGFDNPNGLQQVNGQAYAATDLSGIGQATAAGKNGTGLLTVGSTEASNVDIATEFSKLIVAQRAYSANTKIVTTADQMLQDTINMAR